MSDTVDEGTIQDLQCYIITLESELRSIKKAAELFYASHTHGNVICAVCEAVKQVMALLQMVKSCNTP